MRSILLVFERRVDIYMNVLSEEKGKKLISKYGNINIRFIGGQCMEEPCDLRMRSSTSISLKRWKIST